MQVQCNYGMVKGNQEMEKKSPLVNLTLLHDSNMIQPE